MLNSKIIKPIFIVGVPRSGTTMLYRILCHHSSLAWFSHEDLEFLIPKNIQESLKNRLIKMKENNEKIPRNEESLFVFGLKQGNPLPGTLKVPIEAETFWVNCFGREYIKEVPEEKKKEVLQAIRQVLEKEKKIRFLNKSPQNSMRIFALKKIFPDAIFINIARDPRAVIASMLTRLEREGHFNMGIPLRNNNGKIRLLIQKVLLKSKNYDHVKNFARSYREITENINEFFKSNQENCINIIYEELLAEPEKEISKLLEFCELEKPSDFEKFIPAIQETKNKWKEKITKLDEKKIFKITGLSLKKMKYPYKI